MNPKISVIIPFYNVEKYLDRCIVSVRQQSLKEIEIICVDDCSPDNSYKIAKRHADEDNRIKIFRHSKNLGLGGARNTAIREATADYIASVDSDDFILSNMLNELWVATESGKYDVVCCGFEKVDETGKYLSSHVFPSQRIDNRQNNLNIFSLINPAFWNKLWKRSLFIDNNIFFPDHLFFEDMPTTPRILAKSKYIKVIERKLYRYTLRPESITSTYSPKHILDYFKGFEILLVFLEENNLLEKYREDFIDYINSNIRFYSQKIKKIDMAYSQKKQYLRYILMLKVAFIDYFELIQDKEIEELLVLLETAISKEDLS